MRIKNLILRLGMFLIIWYFSLSNLFATQIEKTIDYRFGQKAADFYGESKFTAQITFDPLPELLKTTMVHVKIMAMRDLDFNPEFFVRTAFNNLIEYTQLTPTIWLPPIYEGDIYEGTFTITPTEMGQFAFKILPKNVNQFSRDDFSFFLAIDESGKLAHLSKNLDQDHAGMTIHPPIVGNDVKLKYRVGKHLDGSIHEDFVNMFHISPLPALDETSTVRFELTANRQCPKGVQFRLTCRGNIDLLDIPKSWIGEIEMGEVHIDSFKIVPKSTGCGWFELWARAHSTPEGKRYTRIPDEAAEKYRATFFIDESGKLTFIGRKPSKAVQEACPYSPYKHKTYVSEPKVFIESKLKKKKTEK